MTQLTCQNLAVGYEGRAVLENLNFSVCPGDYLCIVGENGSGKSTLMKTILGLQPPVRGRVLTGDGLRKNEIGYLPQQTPVQRDFPASVREIVLSGCQGRCGDRPFYSKGEKQLAQTAMERMQVAALAKRCYRTLSGGQQQRVLLARALCAAGDLLVLDEATSGLDPAARSEILDILLDFIQDERHSVLLSSHITTDLEQIADTIAYLHHGQLLFAKNKDDLMEEYGILRCSQQDLDRLPPEWIAATCRTAAGCESLVHPRVSVLRALPGVVCDAASIDDIMRLTSKEG